MLHKKNNASPPKDGNYQAEILECGQRASGAQEQKVVTWDLQLQQEQQGQKCRHPRNVVWRHPKNAKEEELPGAPLSRHTGMPGRWSSERVMSDLSREEHICPAIWAPVARRAVPGNRRRALG
ncbi:hypothetical protein NDU88_002727 [Pleurodeles waltl]|uniref:Uncharacterized protein n=1 Tax=Pleurodeles waltl TaxID=8319 RepID=A0AAV7P7G6_PLEWA|nr:hypothetical protein NDU88_002727 [Pleurodeles waltl]